MVFSSVTFILVFLPLVLLGYLLIYSLLHKPRHSLIWCNTFLFAASILFYAWGEPRFVLILLASTLINYGFGLVLPPEYLPAKRRLILSVGIEENAKLIHRWKIVSLRREMLLAIGITLNLGILCYFKYINFIMDNVLSLLNALLPQFFAGKTFSQVALPLGISFYTFQGISYLMDVYRGETRPARSLINFGCYLTMFPQLVAGPIVRYTAIANELKNRILAIDTFTSGAGRFILGLAKKILIADTLGRVADAAFSIPVQELSPLAAWAGAVCYTLQIYYDFSGYSDMAIGLGHMFGFTFPENFNYPYISRSIKEFWRRWHMTLSGWFKDYLYLPLGGNRYGVARTLFNLLAVFILCGFWHGAAWGFIIWGVYHGGFLVLERLFPTFPAMLPQFVQHAYTLFVVMIGWIIFRADTFTHARYYIKALFGTYDMGVQANLVWMQLFTGDVYLALVFGVLFSAPVIPACRDAWLKTLQRIPPIRACVGESLRLIALLILFAVCLMPLFGSTYNAFIYFRF
ncbi:MBOAT family O-acyltransferase [Desulfococcus multivorans]|uniref:Membrane bound O-acyl transferase MBOAT family protein n=1 Tax=Desulfococcus multivorans DSM 2059 TaxID=1121405 RepID=S7V3S4_DESML|nr:MBOAT family O-acyltransferase [Desulfococcus multivorans]AOY57509.1 AlgI: predicted poly(beta-D-mannuronate) O-acetylase [Desulfococcus multivorans]AQU99936.1 D-alanine export protein [Desulfococcus multivorans]EPR39313.1 membrane bound O-acyl transferase MBOAT family protein [Desulfococcus multivorans DSM 2059]SKA12570.1 alginate O-acetyltransferase complex protein AlgI [Desulfococcus multivorans DSM 2059]